MWYFQRFGINKILAVKPSRAETRLLSAANSVAFTDLGNIKKNMSA